MSNVSVIEDIIYVNMLDYCVWITIVHKHIMRKTPPYIRNVLLYKVSMKKMPNNYKECKAKNCITSRYSFGDFNIFQYTRHYRLTLPLDVLFTLVGNGSEYTLFYIHSSAIIRKHFSLEIILFVTSKADKH